MSCGPPRTPKNAADPLPYQFPLFWLFIVTTALACGCALVNTRFAPLALLFLSPLPVVGYLGIIRLMFIQTEVRQRDKWPLSDFMLNLGLLVAGLVSMSIAFAAFAALVRRLIA